MGLPPNGSAPANPPDRITGYVCRGARGLLYAWDDSARSAVVRALDDEAWRVREMALKVVVSRGIEEAVDQVARLQDDPSARVRASAARARKAIRG